MSAKLSVILYIVICFEIGALLAILPWTDYWENNFFLYFMSAKLHLNGIINVVQSGYARGAVTGLGLLNILLGFLEIFNFRQSVAEMKG
jgi:hypothetical protein